MESEQVRVTFQPSGRTVQVLTETSILEAAARAGLTIESPCGGKGTCGKCRVQITVGACDPTPGDVANLSEQEIAEGWRFACQNHICDDSVIVVPESSLMADGHRILAQTADSTDAHVLPGVRKIFAQMETPTLDDNHADLLRLEEHTGPTKIDLPLLHDLPRRMREWNYSGTAVLTDHHLIDFQEGDTTGQCYGAAFDIGTTTIAGSLMDLTTGDELALESDINPQVRFGDDVLSRINHAATPETREELRSVLLKQLNTMLDALCTQTNVAREDIYEISFAGNTTMEHLLCGIDVVPLGQIPFVPAHARALMVPASELGLNIHPHAPAYVFPIIGGFVGGDTVACMVAADFDHDDGPTLLVDIGTNGEIVLKDGDKIFASSTAAGPAFEGARIRYGMRATTGAIDKIVITDDVAYTVIGDVDPVGLCGSSLVDLISQLLEVGLIEYTGVLKGPDDLPDGLPAALAARVRIGEKDQPEFLLATGAEGDVVLTQQDVREVQLASGAIRAGISILLKNADLQATDLKRVQLAGGFASFIRRSHAQRMGLLPGELDHETIQYIGNASLTGARWALLSTDVRKRAETLARQAEHVELSQDMDFQMAFADAMLFPES